MFRGDVFALKGPRRARGHEQRGSRYAVVVQADQMLGQSTVIVAPTSTSVLDASYRPRISIGDETTRVLVEKLSSVDLGRLGEQQGRVSGGERDAIDDALKLVLDLA